MAVNPSPSKGKARGKVSRPQGDDVLTTLECAILKVGELELTRNGVDENEKVAGGGEVFCWIDAAAAAEKDKEERREEKGKRRKAEENTLVVVEGKTGEKEERI